MLRLFLLVFLVVIIDAGELDRVHPKFRPDYKYVATIGGWMKMHRVPTDWRDARTRCQLEGADLASPSDDLMLNAMLFISKDAVGVNCGVYTGIHSWFSKGDFTSIDGTPLWKMPVELSSSQMCSRKIPHPCTVLFPSGTNDAVDCNQPYIFICYRKYNKEIHNIKSECGTNDPEYKYYETPGRCYKFHLQPQTWPDAYKICLAEGGHLAIVNSDEEVKVISSIFELHPANTMLSKWKDHLLLGFILFNETWNTIHGQSLHEAGFASWKEGQPNNWPHPDNSGHLDLYGNNQSCGSMVRGGLLDDIWCDTQFAFICERPLPDVAK
ncbi:C-type mannose receptor 2-like isoform X1 [Hyposmocoma kahamanoa]|uniref:C-type mannose receptor 2-like isoform X1 n=1 Tax=Hyposmocoma kahamanoa TaxID=1477025 RepID=UPI000E6D5E44|nr:C-type mannose receptor 2-like isoform X1 [Hyposmocoma kahamanoa]